MSKLIVFAGLPGAGKSRLAEALARELGIPVFTKDWLEAALLASHLSPTGQSTPATGYAGYELLYTLARRQLQLGQSAILDSVATYEAIRQRWRGLAHEFGAGFYAIECVCSDTHLHQSRLATRRRGIPGWPELTWADVEAVRRRYEPWTSPHLTVDSALAFEANLSAVRQYLAAADASE